MAATDPPPALGGRARTLFTKRPTWAASTAAPLPAETGDIFAHTKSALPELLREKEERRRRRVEKAKAKNRERSSSDKGAKRKDSRGDVGDEAVVNPVKKRRISVKDYERFGLVSPAKKASIEAAGEGQEGKGGADAGQGYEDGLRHEDDAGFGDERADDRGVVAPPVRFERGVGATMTQARDMHDMLTRQGLKGKRIMPSARDVVTLSDDEDELDDEQYTRGRTRTRDDSIPPPDEDDEFAELAALARERRRRRELEAASGTPGSAASMVMDRKEPEFDPVIKVLVTSPLTNTKPLLVHRKLSQRFWEIRTVWCQRQGFEEEMTQHVFLVYKMRKIYDVTTCKSLGVKVDFEGNVIPDRTRDGFAGNEEDAGRIHVVAVTEEAFDAMKQRRDEKRNEGLNLGMTEEEAQEKAEEEAEVVKVKVLLKAKGYKDYKLIVKSTTTIEKIANAFRREYDIGDEKDVILTQDGERLEMEDEVQDTEIEDMDCLEVHIK